MTNRRHKQLEGGGGQSGMLSIGKRRYTLQVKAWMMEQYCRPDASLDGVALGIGLNADPLRIVFDPALT